MAELDEARAGEFTWGRVIEVHEIGPYAVVEYFRKRPDVYNHGQFIRKGSYETRHTFHVYVNGRDASHGFSTLDGALVFAIAYRHSDANVAGHVAPAFLRGLGDRS